MTMLEPHIENRLSALAQAPLVRTIAQALGPDADLHLVGGSIRDALRGAPVKDYDFACRLPPAEITARIAAAGLHAVPTGQRHQTVTIAPGPSGEEAEISTFRGPDMSPAGGLKRSESIDIDLLYRDFTFNAMALSLVSGAFIDPLGGRRDLEERRVRAAGDAAERFREDPLRVMRMVRFGCTPGFTVDEDTYGAARREAGRISQVSIERVRDELSRILLSSGASFGFRALYDLGILQAVLPELAACAGFEQNRFHPLDVFEHTLQVVEKCRPDLVLRLAALLHDVGKPVTLSVDENGERHFYRHEAVGAEMTAEILERLRYSGMISDAVVTLVQTHMRPTSAGAPGVRRLLRDTGELFPIWRELKEADATSVQMDQEILREELKRFDECVEEVKKGPDVSPLRSLAISGKDLIGLGMTPGPRFGELLRALHERVLDKPELNEKETLLAMVKELSRDSEAG